MKKQLFTKGLRTSILRIGLAMVLSINLALFSASAQSTPRLLNEDFEYTPGDIVGQGAWLRDGTAGSSNILTVVDENLTYKNYQNAKLGKSVQTRIISGQKAILPFAPQTGTIYLSALIRIDSIKSTKYDYIMAFTTGEQNSSPQFAKLYIKDASNHQFNLGVVRTGMTSYGTGTYNWGDTLLIVLKYEVKEGVSNDVVSLWVNPLISSESASSPYIQNRFAEETGDDMTSLAAVQIRQSTTAPMATIDALRVATSWNALFGSESPTPSRPAIVLQPQTVDFGLGYDDFTYHKTLVVKGEKLTHDISAHLRSGGMIRINKTTLSKDKALSESGDSLFIQLNGNHASKTTDTILFSSIGADTVLLPITWANLPLTDLNSLAELRAQVAQDPEYAIKDYRIKEELLISYIFTGNANLQVFAQNDSLGITINDNESVIIDTYHIGDKIQGLVGKLVSSFGSISFVPIREWFPISSGNALTPCKLTLAQLKAAPTKYESRLLELNEVEFPNRKTENNGIFKLGVNPKMTQGEVSVSDNFSLRVLKNVDFIGDTIPAKAHIIGISTAGSGKLIAARSKADITAMVDPIIEPIRTPNLLSNGSFEIWNPSDPLFGDKPADWEISSRSAKENSLIKEGNAALKIVEAPQNYNKIEQELLAANTQIYTDQMYQVSFSYYVVKGSTNGNDISMYNKWTTGGYDMENDKELLANGLFFSSLGKWSTKTIETRAPKNADGFIFNVGVGKEVVAIFDDFSFKRIPDTVLRLYASPNSIPTLSTKVDSTIHSSIFKIDGFNLTGDISIRITGEHASYFTPSSTLIRHATGQSKGEISIAYTPKVAGRHFANIEISTPGTKTILIEIVGSATANIVDKKPSITLSTDTLAHFVAVVGKNKLDSLIINANNLTDYLYASLSGKDKAHFLMSTSMLGKEVVDVKFRITYQPKSEGSHTAYIKFYSKNADTVTLVLKGTASKSSDPELPDILNRKISLDTTHPKILWVENFDNVTHNKAIPDSIMQNVVPQWDRPWWGFYEKDKEGNVVEHVAKATGYVYQNDTAKKCEMWLISPALDFKHAKAKIFTFRVMGDFMFKNHKTKLELFYMEKEGDSSYQNKIEVPMPSIPDENGDWREFHIDLSEQNIADIFFMGFRFTGYTGSTNSVVYYLDNLSFGRTDLASISSPSKKVLLNTQVFTTTISDSIFVGGQNLKEEIQISILGANASKFTASKNLLDPTGGSFQISFSPLDSGLHVAYIKLSSAGAADIIIPLEGRTSAATPKILVSKDDLTIVLRLENGTEVSSKEITVNPFVLTTDITLSLQGKDASQFRLSRTSIPKDGVGQKFTILYHPTDQSKTHQAQVRLHSTGANDVIISVSGQKTTSIEDPIFHSIRIVRTTNGFTLNSEGIQLKEITVYNIGGQRIYSSRNNSSQIEIPIKDRGCYFIKTVSEYGVRTLKNIW